MGRGDGTLLASPPARSPTKGFVEIDATRFVGRVDTTLISVDSTAISAIGWADGVLTVEFRSGRIYDHPRVPYSVFEELMRASSKGAYYNTQIRGRYK